MTTMIALLALLLSSAAFAGQHEIASDNGKAKEFINLSRSEKGVAATLTIDRLLDVSFAGIRFFGKREDNPFDRNAGSLRAVINNYEFVIPWSVMPVEAGWVRFPVDIRMLREGKNIIRMTGSTGTGNGVSLAVDESGSPLMRIVLADDKDESCIGYWNFDLNLLDVSGGGHNAVNGTQYFIHYDTSLFDFGLGFRGRGKEGVKIPALIESAAKGNFSFETWIKLKREEEKESFILDISHWKIILKLSERRNPVLVYWTESGPVEVRAEQIRLRENEWNRIGAVFEQ